MNKKLLFAILTALVICMPYSLIKGILNYVVDLFLGLFESTSKEKQLIGS
jgi:hypothetical protein